MSLALTGCSMSLLGGGDQPTTTGSIAPPVDVQRPLPSTLAFSDATKIGEAANATLMLASGNATGDWINVATGSSGKVETVDLPNPPSQGCHPFSTTVTSIGGVHEYAGAICGNADGHPRVTIDERSPTDRT
jgi:surface antigen